MISKEFGSDFHLCLEPEWQSKKGTSLFLKNTSFFLSGRAALYSLLREGIKKYKWKTVYFPSYYCQEVIQYVKELSIKIKIYNFNPFLDFSETNININDEGGNVVINVDFFGVVKNSFSNIKNVVLIDDLTHNLRSIKESKADFIFGSLRKEIPIPTGGFISTRKQQKLPKGNKNNLALTIVIQKLTAMYLKKRYLEGVTSDKNTYRELFIASEDSLQCELKDSRLPKISNALLKDLNITKILKAKNKNIKVALTSLKIDKKIVLNNNKKKGAGLVFKLSSKKERNDLKAYLVKNNIYPAILWPKQSSKRDVEIENRVLFLHLDYRYDINDVKYIVNKLNLFFGE
ncbi:hypothetical protein [uncultured Algibacter sp.]|uniref:hypothetical protein n=1 Tax=uncultured Algibacter sp. TaxID=298659 RepID=UPI0032169A36